MQGLREGAEKGTRAGSGGVARPDILLIGCVKGKLEWASRVAAKDLYVSALWRCRRKYAEQSGIPWFILSAKYGLVNPETRIAWYDLSLGDLPAAQRRAWSHRVVDALVSRYPSVEGKVVEVHAGKDYVDYGLESGLTDAGMIVQRPLLGIPIGRHLGWYRERGASED
ncbi:MAG: hypothetical protein F4X15_03300 [Gemmatimonadetes bacterium]|nr:hypothetical protein [Gemmatimonadota bacterium]